MLTKKRLIFSKNNKLCHPNKSVLRSGTQKCQFEYIIPTTVECPNCLDPNSFLFKIVNSAANAYRSFFLENSFQRMQYSFLFPFECLRQIERIFYSTYVGQNKIPIFFSERFHNGNNMNYFKFLYRRYYKKLQSISYILLFSRRRK